MNTDAGTLLRYKRALEVLDLCKPNGLAVGKLRAEANLTDCFFETEDQLQADLEAMERDGFVERKLRSRLGRVYVWTITDEGAQALQEAGA